MDVILSGVPAAGLSDSHLLRVGAGAKSMDLLFARQDARGEQQVPPRGLKPLVGMTQLLGKHESREAGRKIIGQHGAPLVGAECWVDVFYKTEPLQGRHKTVRAAEAGS